jgi:hypothetical protein
MPRRIRARLTYANVVATLALFAALGGGAYAAATLPRNSVGARQIRKHAVTPKKLSTATRRYIARRAKGATGAQGPKGDTGDRGPQGLPGADGATGSALLTGHGTGLTSVPAAGTISGRVSPSGLSKIVNPPGLVASLSPARVLVVRDVAVRIDNDIPANTHVSWDLFVQDDFDEFGSAPVISCSITGHAGPGDTRCTAPGPATIPPATPMWVRITWGGSGGPTDPGEASWGMSLEPAPAG